MDDASPSVKGPPACSSLPCRRAGSCWSCDPCRAACRTLPYTGGDFVPEQVLSQATPAQVRKECRRRRSRLPTVSSALAPRLALWTHEHSKALAHSSGGPCAASITVARAARQSHNCVNDQQSARHERRRTCVPPAFGRAHVAAHAHAEPAGGGGHRHNSRLGSPFISRAHLRR